jgi:3-dehydroquinate dehydratase-2
VATKVKIWIINGPNLNLLGTREPQIYGSISFEEYLKLLKSLFSEVEFTYQQNNVEGELINILHEARKEADGVLLNAAAYSHTSIAIADAVAAIEIPVVGIHISNIYQREEERKTDLLAKYCKAYLFGFGLMGYEFGVRYLLDLHKN